MNRDDERTEIRQWLRGETARDGGESPRERLWRSLELPPPPAPPPGFAARVAARATAERRAALGLPLAPAWARAAAALAVLAGIAGGAGLGLAADVDDAAPSALEWSEASLAEELVEDLGADPGAGDVEGAP